MKKNALFEIQEMLLKEMRKLSDDKEFEKNGDLEIARSNSISASALTYVKTINVGIRIMEIAQKNQVTVSSVKKEIGMND